MAHWLKADGWEAAWFKRGADGWIFQSPISWTFGLGPRRHYLLTDTQKTEIVATLNRMDWRYLAGAVAVALVGLVPFFLFVWIVPVLGGDPSFNFGTGILAMFFWAQAVINVALWLLLRSILAGARPTRERITFTERLNASAAMMPTALLLLASLVLIPGFGLIAYEVFVLKKNIGSLVVAVLAAPFVLYICAMLAVKLKAKPTAG
jgi:hypothetical protein